MALKVSDDPSVEVCGTFYAAKVLGVAVATVQSLVKKGELEAWTTKGGHRRITMSSLRTYQEKHSSGKGPGGTASPHLRVLVVDDDEVTLDLLRNTVEKWDLPVDYTFMTSAIEAMLDIGKIQPDVLISDLNMPQVDGFEFLRKLRSNQAFCATAFLVITSLTTQEIADRSGVPAGTPVLQKPLDMRWLHGFISAMVLAHELNRTSPKFTERRWQSS